MSIIGNKTVVGALQDALAGTKLAETLGSLVAPVTRTVADKHLSK